MVSRNFSFLESSGQVLCHDDALFEKSVAILRDERRKIDMFIQSFPEFKDTLEPWDVPSKRAPPRVVERMIEASILYGVGPMAGVAGALADQVVELLDLGAAEEFIMENGGEIRIHSPKEVIVGLIGVKASIGSRIGFKILPEMEFLKGIGTSSSTFGRGLSFGSADIVTVFSSDATKADSAATRICNESRGKSSKEAIENAINHAKTLRYVSGVLVVVKDLVGTWGRLPELVSIKGKDESHVLIDFE
ncbi:MAG: UPF0280 family protein [Promethearchaeota archaeon]